MAVIPLLWWRVRVEQKDYLLGHSGAEVDRLQRQADMLNPTTLRLLQSAGLETGMRVLDIGCGPGDVTMLAAQIVGPAGHVVGIDLSDAAVDAARGRLDSHDLTNVEFTQSDVESYNGPADFDMIICRYVLIHQSDPIRFLQSATRLLRPGGVLALHETDTTRGIQTNPPLPLLTRIDTLMRDAFRNAVAAGDAGGRLFQLFADAGLPRPHVFAETFVESGGDAKVLAWAADTARTLLPQIVASGAVTEDEIGIDTLVTRLRQDAIDTQSQIEFHQQICGWARMDVETSRAATRLAG
jgi:ubiquinone/menaquinone biosynthesis C-methylase UbiE